MANPPRVVPFRRTRTPPPPPPGGWPSWFQLLRRDNGRVIPDLANVLIALRNDPEFGHAVAFNEMLWHSVALRKLPCNPEADLEKPLPHKIDDDDIIRTQEWLQTNGMPKIGRENIFNAVETIAHEHAFHPVRDWLESLRWDGEPRLYSSQGPWLTTYLGAVEQSLDYLATIGQCFLISMIARVMEPPCQADYMLVLEGDQGVEKSRACRKLAGDEWFGDSLPDIHTKDAKIYLDGKWLVEASELAAFFGRGAETEYLKAFLTRQSEDFRPPYAHHNIQKPRQCVFIGTTNQRTYIKDNTGARRFWPVRVGKIDTAAIERDRDQLFAEALALYHDRQSWWPNPDLEARIIKPEQETRIEAEPWESAIAAFLDGGGVTPLTETTIPDIAKTALGFDGMSRVEGRHAQRIAIVLGDLGWVLKREKHRRYWVKRVTVGDGG